MNVTIHSFDSIEKLAEKPFEKRTALISLCDVGMDEPMLKYRPEHMLTLHFDDITPEDVSFDESGRYAGKLYTEVQANKIAEFIYAHKDEVDAVICQCLHGMSRSAAVAAALMEHFDHNGIEVFVNGDYYPNVFVYKLTKNSLERYDAMRKGGTL